MSIIPMTEPQKWNLPGWRIEQKYANNVLIGNWSEDREKYLKGNFKHNSTNRLDFRDFGLSKPDTTVRRKGQLRNEGLPAELLFHHHGKRYASNWITWYDEHYNKREREPWDRLPDLRHWDGHRMSWLPEKTDHPMQGAPTVVHSSREKLLSNVGDYETTYGYSYYSQPPYKPSDHYAIPRAISSTLHRVNKVNQDLDLRGIRSSTRGWAPEPPPKLIVPMPSVNTALLPPS